MTEALHEPTTMPKIARGAPLPKGSEVHLDEVEELHSADRKAAAMVAGLMVSIFTIGMVIYVYVFFCALAGPP